MIDRLPRSVERTVAATTVLLAGVAVSGCAKEQPPVREAGCFEARMDFENPTVHDDLPDELYANPAITDKDYDDTDGIHGVGQASQNITKTIRELRKKEGNRRYSNTDVSVGDEYGYCVDEDGKVTKGPKKLFKTVEQKTRDNY